MAAITAVGIDVGGARKGSHAVALTDGAYISHPICTALPMAGEYCSVVTDFTPTAPMARSALLHAQPVPVEPAWLES